MVAHILEVGVGRRRCNRNLHSPPVGVAIGVCAGIGEVYLAAVPGLGHKGHIPQGGRTADLVGGAGVHRGAGAVGVAGVEFAVGGGSHVKLYGTQRRLAAPVGTHVGEILGLEGHGPAV